MSSRAKARVLAFQREAMARDEVEGSLFVADIRLDLSHRAQLEFIFQTRQQSSPT